MKNFKSFEFYSKRWGELTGDQDEDLEKIKNSILNLLIIAKNMVKMLEKLK